MSEHRMAEWYPRDIYVSRDQEKEGTKKDREKSEQQRPAK